MAQDFAKTRKQSAGGKSRKKKPASRKTTARADSSSAGRGQFFALGMFSGIFLSLLVYLSSLPPAEDSAPAQAGHTTDREQPPKPRFDFYTLLPEQSIGVEVEPAQMARPRATPSGDSEAGEFYLLQAGSFRQQQDADRRRAELLLLGLEPRVEEAKGDNGRWFRVYLGPFDSRSKMARARSLTANQDIDTLLLKRREP